MPARQALRPTLSKCLCATALLALAIASSAQAQTASKSEADAQGYKDAFNKGMAKAMLPMEALVLEGCRKLAPGESQGVEADWAKRMADPVLKAYTLTPDYAQELAKARPMLDADLAKPDAAKTWAPKCKAGLR